MFPSVSLVLLAVVLAVDAAPSPRTTLPILTKYAEKRGGGYDIIKADAARIAHLVNHGYKIHAIHNGTAHEDKRATYSFAVTNAAVSYTASVGVGSPAKYYTLVVDTGSSNTWVGAQTSNPYVVTSTSKSTGSSVGVTYGSGSFTGTLYSDQVTLASNLVISSQKIGAASSASGFGSGIDGILGVGPTILTSGTISGSSSTIPTVSDSLFAANTISTEALGIYFAPSTSRSSTNGELTFGGADTSKCTSSITYAPITTTSPSKYYWGIQQSVQYNGKSILGSTAGIVDTGTTLIYLASNAYTSYVSATNATLDSATGFLRINSTQYANLKNMNFYVQGKTLTLIPNAQIWPRALNTYIGGSSNYVYLIVNNLGSASGSGLDFINGQKFLERFYSVYDTTAKRVGFATTSYTTQNIN